MKFSASLNGSMARLANAGLVAVIASLAVGLFGLVARPAAAQAQSGFNVRTISTRADLVTGGDVLVQVKRPANVAAGNVSIVLNGKDVTAAFRPGRDANTLIGRVKDLPLGASHIEAGGKGQKATAQVTIVNHPIAGPVIAGPHQTPFVCETATFGLEALDTDCAAKTKVEYFYRSTIPPTPPAARENTATGARGANPGVNPEGLGNPAGANPFKPYDPNGPRPTDLAMTTTSEGKTVPYLVRREMGTINRAVYVITFLHEPGTPLPDPWTQTPGWNGKLIYSFGGGCGAGYHQGRTIGGLTANRGNLEDGQLGDYGLAKGYAVAGASLNVFGTSCADLISTETMMMVKEHFIEQFGVPKYTVGSGRSGGSMQQHMIANNYPGLLDGIVPTASFSDTMTFLTPLFDCELLGRAFDTSAYSWTFEQKTVVAGSSKTWEYCPRTGTAYPLLRAATDCDTTAISKDKIYDPVTAPKGARCTYQDNMVNVFGRDPKTGFGRRPFDNVGIQYGLGALNAGQITFDQFLDLNTRVGGHDIDGHIVAARTVADPEALRIAYQTGRINDAGHGLAAIPIIDMRPYVDDQPNVHDGINTYITRARLIAANGTADNQVLHVYDNKASVTKAQDDNLDLLDRWITAIQADTKPAKTQLEKVIRNKPADAMDACYTASLEKLTDWARCKQMFPVYSDPRMVAGAPMSADRFKCELKPIAAKDYKQPLTAAQLASVKTTFPQGVCDYSKKGVNQAPSQIWLSYPRSDTTNLARN